MSITVFSCPTYRVSLVSASGFASKLYTLGPPTLSCSKCGTIIRTGAKEWQDLTLGQRRRLWFQYRVLFPFILGPISIPLLAGVACLPLSIVKAFIPLPNAVFFTIAGFVGVIVGVWFAVSQFRSFVVAVAESEARWKETHVSKGAHEQPPDRDR